MASGIFPPDSGGPATHLTYLLPELRSRGHEIRALAFGAPRPDDDSYPVTRVPLDSFPLRQLRYARAYRKEAAWADAVYASSLGLPRPWPSRPTVLRIPGDRAWERAVNRGLVSPTEDIDRFQHARSGVRVRYLKWLRAREARRADRVIAPSEYVRAMIVGWGVDPSRVRVIYSATPSELPAGFDRTSARRSLGWTRDGFYLLAVARLTAWKGLDVVIDAVARLPAATLVIAGDGPERHALAARAESCRAAVQLVGTIEPHGLTRYLAASDYLVLYSGYEGLSHTILESLRAGTPVIASDRGGNPEVVRHGENGFLVKHPDPGALHAALTCARDPAMRSRLAAGTAAGLERFSWAAAAPAIVAELEAAAAGRERARR